LMRADPRPDTIDLGIGVYRDEAGRAPVSASVKAAERYLLETQATKAYVGPAGDSEFARQVQDVVIGRGAPEAERIASVQAAGGTGALRLAMELIAHTKPGARVWLGTPSWPNHAPLIAATGLEFGTYRYYDPATATLDFAVMMDVLSKAAAGDVVLLHGCCHNPTGAELGFERWRDVTAMIERRGLLPLIDMAYQGLGEGLDRDAAGVRYLLEHVPEALIAASCSKSFGLYRERTGILIALTANAADAATVGSNLQSMARLLYSNPPDHGAAVVRTILGDTQLERDWRAGLEAMRVRIRAVRTRLSRADGGSIDFSSIAAQNGLFALLPLDPEEVDALRRDHGIYMARSGRINVAGLNDGNLDRFVAAVASLPRRRG
ncbi:aromatic amino acid transaminase, partial [Sphingopyxis sp.]|uniref:amino acid aminotransferase n=1 Tax=Sphingopyxis sp. TaxID=1908224 RepID=UPI003D6CCA9B